MFEIPYHLKYNQFALIIEVNTFKQQNLVANSHLHKRFYR